MQGIHKVKLKNAGNEKRKKLRDAAFIGDVTFWTTVNFNDLFVYLCNQPKNLKKDYPGARDSGT